MLDRNKLIRITTVPQSLRTLLCGQLRFMRENGYDVIGVSSPGEALEDVRNREQINTVAIKMTRTITPLKDVIALFKLILLFRKEKPNIIHTHTPKAGLLGMIAGKFCGVPNRLHTVAGMPLLVATGNRKRLLSLMEKMTYRFATKVYPNSYGLKKIILKDSFTNCRKLKVIGNGSSNGIDTSFFDPRQVNQEKTENLRQHLGIAENSFVYLFVGRLVKDKGINELVEAFKNISRIKPSAHLVLVGSSEKELDPLSEQTEREMASNLRIHAVGFQKDVRQYFGMADVLVFPSYREGFPNVVMQAAAMQLNCIVSDINGCNEIIEDDVNGWVVPAKSTSELENKMQWCVENQEISRRMGLIGREKMVSGYERQFIWNEMLKEYNSLFDV